MNNYCWHRLVEPLSVIYAHTHSLWQQSGCFLFLSRLGTSVQTFCQAGVNLPLSWMDQSPTFTTQRQKDYLHLRVLKIKILPSVVNQISEASVVFLNLGSFVYQVLTKPIVIQQCFLFSEIISL